MRAVVLAVLAAVSPAVAEPRAARVPVGLADALAAVPRAPAALVGPHEVAAAEASVDAASAWPSPSLHLATNRLTARLVAGATVPLPVFGTVGAARRQAAAEADVVRADTEVVRRDLRHRVVVAWIQLARADGDVEATTIAAQQSAELERIAKGRVGAGVGADVDVTVAGAARARADVAVAAALRGEDAASAELAGVLGWDPARPLRAAGEPPTEEPRAIEALRARLAQHPERAAAARRVASAEATIDTITVQRYPLLAFEGTVSVDDRSIDQTGGANATVWDRTDVSIGVGLELPLFAHVGDKARAAQQTEAAQRARLAVTDAELAAALQAAYERWRAASERLAALERDVVPAQDKASTLSAQAYREGARDLASALQAARDLAAVRAEINSARADAAIALADLQLAAGEEVGGAR